MRTTGDVHDVGEGKGDAMIACEPPVISMTLARVREMTVVMMGIHVGGRFEVNESKCDKVFFILLNLISGQ
jgi:hypothetical protein